MRGKKTVINTAMSLLEEAVSIVCGFILPRLILTVFGSQYNGLTTSITQFLACAVLLRAGIGGATRAALYKPLAKKNKDEINSIIKSTDIFMKKISLILCIAILGFAVIYPFIIKNDFGWLFTFSLFVIIGASTFAESFFGITYLILLQADQRVWLSSLLRSVSYILNVLLAVVLIYNGCSIHIVKLGSAVVFVLYPIILRFYVKRKYSINTKNVKPNNEAIAQRWDAFWHQVSVFAMNNTDIIVLSIFTDMLEVSVYSIYNMVIGGLKRMVLSFSNGIEAAFGNMLAKNEQSVLRENLSVFELIMYSISTIVYTCSILLILQFVNVYTRGVTDADYLRPAFAYILLIAQFFNGVRLPYQLIVQAAGHYKQTRNGAMIEPILNIGLSVLMVIKFGLIGVAIGTLAATIFRTVQFSVYMCRHLVKRSQFITVLRCAVSFLEGIIVVGIVRLLKMDMPENYLQWVIEAIIVCVICSIIVISINLLFFRKDTLNLVKKLKIIIKPSSVKSENKGRG